MFLLFFSSLVSLFLINKILISLLSLFYTFYSIVLNNKAILPAGCNLIQTLICAFGNVSYGFY